MTIEIIKPKGKGYSHEGVRPNSTRFFIELPEYLKGIADVENDDSIIISRDTPCGIMLEPLHKKEINEARLTGVKKNGEPFLLRWKEG